VEISKNGKLAITDDHNLQRVENGRNYQSNLILIKNYQSNLILIKNYVGVEMK